MIKMNDSMLDSPAAIKTFLAATSNLVALSIDKAERYAFVASVLARTDYHQLKRCDKGVVRKYIQYVTGYSAQQLTRLINQHHMNSPRGRY